VTVSGVRAQTNVGDHVDFRELALDQFDGTLDWSFVVVGPACYYNKVLCYTSVEAKGFRNFQMGKEARVGHLLKSDEINL
jgi:hypothetical protein